jgi:hypothetical protein
LYTIKYYLGFVTSCVGLSPITDGERERRIEVTKRRGRKRKQLLDEPNPLKAELNPICHLLALLGAHPILHVRKLRVKEQRGYWRLKKKAPDRTLSRSHFGSGYGPVVRQTAE